MVVEAYCEAQYCDLDTETVVEGVMGDHEIAGGIKLGVDRYIAHRVPLKGKFRVGGILSMLAFSPV